MGGPQFEKKDMPEVSGTRSSGKMDEHEEFIQRFVEKGYIIESQEDTEETGTGNELIAEVLTTILKPPMLELPKLKFVAKMVYGKYSFEDEKYVPFEDPRFELSTYKKHAGINHENDPWGKIDMS